MSPLHLLWTCPLSASIGATWICLFVAEKRGDEHGED